MKPLSERIKDFPADQFVDWLCLSCVDVREVRNEEDAQGEINKIRKAVTERLTALEKQRDTLAAENAILKSGIGFFSYGTDSGFEEHDSAEKAIAAADSDIDHYRGDACDGWSEETDCTVWGVIMQRATVTGLRAVTEDDNCDPSIKEWCDYTLLPNIATPATDAYLNSVRADAIRQVSHEAQGYEEQFKRPLTSAEWSTLVGNYWATFDGLSQAIAGKDGE